jgi:hypothetical protein
MITNQCSIFENQGIKTFLVRDHVLYNNNEGELLSPDYQGYLEDLYRFINNGL